MALQATGTIAFSEIASEFGDSPPFSLSEFYRGGGKVPAGNTNVPASGAIGFGHFYGASNQFAFTIAASVNDANLRTLALNAGWDGSAALTVTIATGVIIGGSTTTALTIDGSFPSGVTVINNGTIVGKNGVGGTGGTYQTGGVGGAGGPAVSATTTDGIIFDNANGSIYGGGGGGGGGGGYYYYCPAGGGEPAGYVTARGGNGGRGAGLLGGALAGSNGLWDYTGNCSGTGGKGGTGGSYGTAGYAGFASSRYSGGAGGAAGKAVSGNSNITWTATGSRIGPIV